MVIIGIDPGTATTGFGVIKTTGQGASDAQILEFGVVSTPKNQPEHTRLLTIYTDLKFLIKKYKPDKIGVEKLFFTTNQKTALSVSQARGVVLLLTAEQNIVLKEFTPLQVKNILCGYGKADKKQVQFMVKKTFGLTNTPKPDDASDALAIALCAMWQK